MSVKISVVTGLLTTFFERFVSNNDTYLTVANVHFDYEIADMEYTFNDELNSNAGKSFKQF